MPQETHSAFPDTLAAGSPPESDSTRGRPTTWVTAIGLTAIVALAAFLRLWQAGESLWIDELHTSWVVSGKLRDVLPRAAMGNQSPLYFWGVWLLVQVTGQSEWSLRLPSLLAGIALPAAVFFLARQVCNLSRNNPQQLKNLPYVSLAAALLVAIDPTCIFYSQEARPYAWVMLLAVAELALLKRLVERPAVGYRMALLANSLLLFYLHYTTAIFLVGIIVLLPMLVRLTGSRYRTRDLAIDLLAAAALAVPGVVQLADIFRRRTNWEAFVDRPTWPALVTKVPFTLWVLIGAAIVSVAVLMLLAPRVLPGNALTRGSALPAPRIRSWTTGLSERSLLWYGALLASILVPLLLSWIVTRLDAARIFHVRYLVALIPLAAVAACLATAWIPWRNLQFAVLVLLAGWHLHDGGLIEQFARDGRFLAARNEDWRGAVKYINARLAEDDSAIAILVPDLIELKGLITNESERQYGLFPVRGIYQVNNPRLHLWGTWGGISSEMDLLDDWEVGGSRRAWYIVRNGATRASDLIQENDQMLATTDSPAIRTRVTENRAFGRIRLFSLAPERRK